MSKKAILISAIILVLIVISAFVVIKVLPDVRSASYINQGTESLNEETDNISTETSEDCMIPPQESTGISDGFMPNLIGLTKEEALKQLTGSGVDHIDFQIEYNECSAKGNVLRQNYPAYAKIRYDFKYLITLSDGPDPLNHDEIVAFCDKKGYTPELRPYIVAAVKFLIKNTVLSKDEILERLDRNVQDIGISNHSIGVDGSYTFSNIILDHYLMNVLSDTSYKQKVLIHEMVHALSYDRVNNKFGFGGKTINDGNDHTNLSEGYTDTIASKSILLKNVGVPVLTDVDNNNQAVAYEISSQAYLSEAAILRSLDHLMGGNKMEQMFFADYPNYIALIDEFDKKYGSGTWQLLLYNGNKMIEHIYGDKSQYCKNYYNKIIECLQIDFINCGDDIDKLAAFSAKLSRIQPSLPLEFNNYREKIVIIRKELNKKLEENHAEQYIVPTDTVILPDFTGMHEGAAYRWLKAYVDIDESCSYTGYSDTIPFGYVMSISKSGEGILKQGMSVNIGGSYSMVVSHGVELPDGWVLVPNIIEYYGNAIFEERLEDARVYRHLQQNGFKPAFELLDALPGNQNTDNIIWGQYPEVGTAVKTGAEIRIKVLKAAM